MQVLKLNKDKKCINNFFTNHHIVSAYFTVFTCSGLDNCSEMRSHMSTGSMFIGPKPEQSWSRFMLNPIYGQPCFWHPLLFILQNEKHLFYNLNSTVIYMFSHLLIKYLPCFIFKKRTQKVPFIRPMQKVQRDGVTTWRLYNVWQSVFHLLNSPRAVMWIQSNRALPEYPFQSI